MKLAVAVLGLGILCAPLGAAAEPPSDEPTRQRELGDPGWSPGSRTTSKLGAQLERRDEGPLGDGVYGRFDGDMTFALHAGVALFDQVSYAAADFSLHYFWTAGVYANLREGVGGEDRLHERSVGVGVDLRPLFLPRLALDMERGPAWVDLTLDSLSFGLGAYFAKARQVDASERGLELSGSLGVPLFRSAAGPWLRLRAERRLGSESGADSETTIAIQLAWHLIWASPLSTP